MEKNENEVKNPLPGKSLVVVFPYHHKNTEKMQTSLQKSSVHK